MQPVVAKIGGGRLRRRRGAAHPQTLPMIVVIGFCVAVVVSNSLPI